MKEEIEKLIEKYEYSQANLKKFAKEHSNNQYYNRYYIGAFELCQVMLTDLRKLLNKQ